MPVFFVLSLPTTSYIQSESHNSVHCIVHACVLLYKVLSDHKIDYYYCFCFCCTIIFQHVGCVMQKSSRSWSMGKLTGACPACNANYVHTWNVLGTVRTYIVVVVILSKSRISVLVVNIVHVSCTHHLPFIN